MKVFVEEKGLVWTGFIGFLLAAVCAVAILLNGAAVPPEGNIRNAFSFNAAIGMFLLSIAVLMPIAGLGERKRVWLRRGFIATGLIGYGIETIQHFRGINPRFSQVGSIADLLIGSLFGLISIVLIVVTVLLAVSYFSRKMTNRRLPLILSIRYAFVSTMMAFAGGIIMSVLQSRYIGPSGNWIVIHGLGFHALQALPLIGWLWERSGGDERRAKLHVHWASIAWMSCIVMIGVQTALGRSVFEFTVLPVLAALAIVISLWVLGNSMRQYLKKQVRNGSQAYTSSP